MWLEAISSSINVINDANQNDEDDNNNSSPEGIWSNNICIWQVCKWLMINMYWYFTRNY